MKAPVSRRRALLGAAVLPAVPAPAQFCAAEARNPDAELIRRCEAALAWHADMERLSLAEDAAFEAGDRVEEERLHEAQCAMVPRLHELLADAWELPAHTSAGAAARARLALTRVSYAPDGIEPHDSDEQMLWQLCQDILTLGGAA
ncbi:hypothetical protein M0638_20490 [Roseomonas sp. NAR14]|uniref:Secreted protein n=1 Tax=Roseomonas acroporae TaxID=2937791 RepID=A0A9X1Y9S1_9PROT|nr:hypothetical protein [Roseomonas acroporae]MCK8786754.1 hypothetical protein [Roseomonas acroporae]